jgi:hypothetical protein
MNSAEIQAVMIFSAVIVGVTSAGYLYQSVSPLLGGIRKALRLFSFGMLLITFGVLVAASIIFSPNLNFGFPLSPYQNALSILFYLLFIAGSILILLGGRQFNSRRPAKVVDVSLQGQHQ